MIKIAQINIETDKHLKRFIPFFKKEKVDVLMLQEVMKKDVAKIQNELGFRDYVFQEMFFHKEDENLNQGIAIFTNLKFEEGGAVLLGKKFRNIPEKDYFQELDIYMLYFIYESFGTQYTFATTHFPVNYAGRVSKLQEDVCDKLLGEVSRHKNIILTGDFNAPRGRKIFDMIALAMTDNIPEDAITTIDQKLHRKKGLQFVIDGMFTRGNIILENVTLHDGLSDHMAVIGEVINLEK